MSKHPVFALLLLASCALQSKLSTSSSTSTPPVTDERASGGGTTSVSVTVPDVIGMSRRDAVAAFRAAGITGEIRTGNDPGQVDVDTAVVCSHVPGGGNQTSSTLFVMVTYCQDNIGKPHDHPSLVGMTVADAKAFALHRGFKGTIEVVELSDFDPSCEAGVVCRVMPDYWDLDQGRGMQLYVNKKPSTGAPPPE